MKNIEAARAKAAAGERLTLEDALALYEDNDLLFLADCARRAKEKKERPIGLLHRQPPHQPDEYLQLELPALRLPGGGGRCARLRDGAG